MTQSRFNTASRLAAATAILVGGGLSIANPVDIAVNASAAGITSSPAPFTAKQPVEKGGGQDPDRAKAHHHEPGAERGKKGTQSGEEGSHGTDHEGMNHDGMGHEGTPQKRKTHEGMDHGGSPDRETHRQKSR